MNEHRPEAATGIEQHESEEPDVNEQRTTPALDGASERRLSDEEAYGLLAYEDWRALAPRAATLRDAGWGRRVSYSRKVFIPLTRLCRDVCHYCTFATTPSRLGSPYLTPDEALAIARAGQAAGCKEALFTLGDRPEARYDVAREVLEQMGYDSTLAYVEAVARKVLDETGLLPHINAGLMDAQELARLRLVAPSMGLMLETSSERLSEHGGPHFGSHTKHPMKRLEMIRMAGEARVPFTSGLLIGIGETRRERIDALLALRTLHEQHGHLQEVIVQNFRAKPGTQMAGAQEPPMSELLWTVAVARLVLGAHMSLQVPPNLYGRDLAEPIQAGINDWGGVSPVTPDHVNPEAPWPHLESLAQATASAGHVLVERLTIYPRYVEQRSQWLAPELHGAVLRLADAGGLARVGSWSPGVAIDLGRDDLADIVRPAPRAISSSVREAIAKAQAGRELTEGEINGLFHARAADFDVVCAAADELRRSRVGDAVTYAVVRNINYTNVCLYKCGFCAFSKGRAHEDLRGKPYFVDRQEIARRVQEAWARGATEVCMQGGIHPSFTGHTYLDILKTAKQAAPAMHVHAFSPLEVAHGASTLGLSTADYLRELKKAGLGSLPGTAAEILDDEVRANLCPDKLSTDEWLRIVADAHEAGLPTTSTIMFGHMEAYGHWARHLLRLRRLQQATGGITEFVPLPFVHMEAPVYRRGLARKGPTLRETVLMHAVSRLVLHPLIPNIQVSWVKLGREGALRCLSAGANDLGGTLMNESISRAAGAAHGQELGPAAMEELIRSAGRTPVQRTTLYQPSTSERRQASFSAAGLREPINQPAGKRIHFAMETATALSCSR